MFASMLAWLQMGRVLNAGLVLVLALGLILVEFLLRLGERSTWSPNQARPAQEGDPDTDG